MNLPAPTYFATLYQLAPLGLMSSGHYQECKRRPATLVKLSFNELTSKISRYTLDGTIRGELGMGSFLRLHSPV
jgi:hypothetical protein